MAQIEHTLYYSIGKVYKKKEQQANKTIKLGRVFFFPPQFCDTENMALLLERNSQIYNRKTVSKLKKKTQNFGWKNNKICQEKS